MSITLKPGLAVRAATVSLIATTIVVAIKLVAGILSKSVSVMAEALQSTLDVVTALMAVGTIRLSAKPADEDHPYGHGKAELISSALQMLVMISAAAFILYEAYQRFLKPEVIRWDWGAGAMAYAVISNLIVARWINRVAKQTGSTGLASEGLHLQADTYSSVGVLVGVTLCGLTGLLWIDPVVAATFTIISIHLAIKQLISVLHPLMDGSLPSGEVAKLEEILHHHPQVRGYHNLRSRYVGSFRYVDLHVMLDDTLPFVEAHDIAEHIEAEMKMALGGGVVSIHYEPYEAELAHRAREHRDSV